MHKHYFPKKKKNKQKKKEDFNCHVHIRSFVSLPKGSVYIFLFFKWQNVFFMNSSFLLFCVFLFFACPTAFLFSPTKMVTQQTLCLFKTKQKVICSPAGGNQVNINLLMRSVFSVRCVIRWLKLLHFVFVLWLFWNDFLVEVQWSLEKK